MTSSRDDIAEPASRASRRSGVKPCPIIADPGGARDCSGPRSGFVRTSPVDDAAGRPILVQAPLQVQSLEDELDGGCHEGGGARFTCRAIDAQATAGLGHTRELPHPADVLA